jgi:hypothetical protein
MSLNADGGFRVDRLQVEEEVAVEDLLPTGVAALSLEKAHLPHHPRPLLR